MASTHDTYRSEFLPHLGVVPALSLTGALIMDVTYGMNIKSHEDQFLQAAGRAMQSLERAVIPGAFLVNTIPIRVSTISCRLTLDSSSLQQSQARAGVVSWCGVQDFRKGSEGTI